MFSIRWMLFVCLMMVVLFSFSGCDCCGGDCDDEEKGGGVLPDDDDDDSDDDDVDDDDATGPCVTTASYPAGEYYFPIRVTLNANCDGKIYYLRERFDGSGDSDFFESDNPVHDIYIDRDTTLRFYSEIEDVFLEDEQKFDYDFPPKFRGIMWGHAGDMEITLQWQQAWDSDSPIVYNVYKPLNDAPIPTLIELTSTDQLEITLDDSIVEGMVNGTPECFVVRAQDATGQEDLNYVSYCLNPQPVFHVDAAAPPGGDGSAGSPFNSIQAANDAMPITRYFTNIFVAEGQYDENIDFNNNDPPITTHIRAAQIYGGFDPDTWHRYLPDHPTIIDGGGGGYGIKTGEWDLIDGFYITNAADGMLFDNRMSVTIRNCFLHDNFNNGISIDATDVISGPSITSTVCARNGNGIKIRAVADSDSDSGVGSLLRNLILYDNASSGLSATATGDGPHTVFLDLRIRNVLIAENERGLDASLSGAGIEAIFEVFNDFIGDNKEDIQCSGCGTDTLFIEFSDILDPGSFDGFGMISVDPMFIGPPVDFQLMEKSPLVDAGSPDWLFNDPDRTRNDIGAFGGIGGSWDPLKFSY